MSEDGVIIKSGFIAVMGRPNVGKSCLINALVGQKIAAVSHRPQTTRKRQLGILTLPEAQLVFIDTPGLHSPRHKLGEHMNNEAREALEHCDLILFVVEATQPPNEDEHMLAGLLVSSKRLADTLLVLNKADLAGADALEEIRRSYQELIPGVEALGVSATRGDHLPELLAVMLSRLKEGPQYYPEDQATDAFERDIAANLIRESCLNHLRDEVPHGIAVRIDEYRERDEQGAYIEATILVERESHKGIVIGQKGSMLKTIGSAARQEIEAMSDRKVYLRLNVKVRANWRNDEQLLKRMGY